MSISTSITTQQIFYFSGLKYLLRCLVVLLCFLQLGVRILYVVLAIVQHQLDIIQHLPLVSHQNRQILHQLQALIDVLLQLHNIPVLVLDV